MENKYDLFSEKKDNDKFSQEIKAKHFIDVFICATMVAMVVIESINLTWILILSVAGVLYCLMKVHTLSEVYDLADEVKKGKKIELRMNGEIVKNKDLVAEMEASLNAVKIKEVKKEIKGFIIRAYLLSTVASIPLLILIYKRLTSG